jgi:hypothetical protein
MCESGVCGWRRGIGLCWVRSLFFRFYLPILISTPTQLGNTPSTFMMIKEPVSAKNMLAKIDLQPDIALICLNDDVVRGEEIVNEVVGAWQKRRWGEKAEWEV